MFLQQTNKFKRKISTDLYKYEHIPTRKEHKYAYSIIPIGNLQFFGYYQIFPTIAIQSQFPKRFPKITPRRVLPKGVIENCSAQVHPPPLFLQVIHKIIPQSCSRKLLPKAAPELRSTAPKLPELLSSPKAIPQNYSQM